MNADKDTNILLVKANEKLITALIDYENERFDDSISRSYYAVYHALTACLLSKNLTFSSHSQTIGAFNREFIKTEILDKNFTSMIYPKLFKLTVLVEIILGISDCGDFVLTNVY